MRCHPRRLLAALPRLLFPPRCALCDAACAGPDLCAGCRDDLPRPGPACSACAEPQSAEAGLCARCRHLAPPMAATRTALLYEFPADWLLTELKFRARLWHGPLLASLIAEVLLPQERARLAARAVVLPVPLHRRRLAARGYNQAAEIARPLAAILGCPCDESLLVRHRATREQSALSARSRRSNVAGAFRLRRAPACAEAVVVDDVVTTGATVREVAAVLRRGGVERVTVLAGARAR